MSTRIPSDEYLPEALHKQAAELVELRERSADADGVWGDYNPGSARGKAAEQAARRADADRVKESALKGSNDLTKLGQPATDKFLAARQAAQLRRDGLRSALSDAENAFSAALRDHGGELVSVAEGATQTAGTRYQAAVDELVAARREYMGACGALAGAILIADEARYNEARGGRSGGYSHPSVAVLWRPDLDSHVRVGAVSIDTNKLPAVLAADAKRHVPPEPKQPTADDLRLSRSMAATATGRAA